VRCVVRRACRLKSEMRLRLRKRRVGCNEKDAIILWRCREPRKNRCFFTDRPPRLFDPKRLRRARDRLANLRHYLAVLWDNKRLVIIIRGNERTSRATAATLRTGGFSGTSFLCYSFSVKLYYVQLWRSEERNKYPRVLYCAFCYEGTV